VILFKKLFTVKCMREEERERERERGNRERVLFVREKKVL
jgi:hypothetical protein